MGRLIRRVLLTSLRMLDGHLSTTCVAARLQRSTRELDGQPVTFPVRPCSGRGLPSRPGHPGRWWSLTPPFHPYRRLAPVAVCFLLHCSRGLPRVGVTHRPALRSPDVPREVLPLHATVLPTHSGAKSTRCLVPRLLRARSLRLSKGTSL